MNKILLIVSAMIFTASVCFADEVPSYNCKVANKINNMKLSLDCVISNKVEKNELIKLGNEVYNNNNGKNYKNVFIMWYLPYYKIGSGAWGTTNFVNGNLECSILSLQD